MIGFNSKRKTKVPGSLSSINDGGSFVEKNEDSNLDNASEPEQFIPANEI